MECVWDVGTETQLTSSEARKGIILDSMYIQGLATCFPKIHKIEIAGESQTHLRPNNMGTGIWWTTPILLWLVIDFRRIIRDREKRTLLIAAGFVFVVLMFYHSTGYSQRGFNRYSMDYLPVLFVLVVPGCIHGWRRWLSAAMIVWSVVYFRFLI